MKNKIYSLFISLVLASLVFAGFSTLNNLLLQPTKVSAVVNTVTYANDTFSFANPERGMYSQLAFSNNESHNYSAQDLIGVKQNYKISTFRIYYFIDDYLNAPFPQSFLDKLNEDAAKFRQAGLKFMPTFTYVPNEGTTDAGVARILAHIDQITPFLQSNSDVIAAVYAGFVGDYGEWHDSLAGNLGVGISTNQNSLAIINKLLNALPSSRSILLRTPLVKRQFVNNALPLTNAEAFSGTNKARIGHQNDSLLSGIADRGTYDFDQNGAFALDVESNRNYVNTDGAFVPNSGESGDLADITYQNCNAARPALAALHQDFIHDKNYYPGDGVYDYGPATGGKYPLTATLQREGCFEEVSQKLGYRIRLVTSTLNNTAILNSNLSLNLKIKNEGYASPFNPRGLEVILRNSTTGANFKINVLNSSTDPRLWFPEKGEFEVNLDAPLTSVPPGNYSVLLNLPDPEASLRNRADYSIRFANTNMWEPTTGYNNLQQTLTITNPPTNSPCTIGNYSSTGYSPCLPCPQNTYCSSTSTITPANCPATYLSPAGSIYLASCVVQVCQNGATNPSLCNTCPFGKYLNPGNICVPNSIPDNLIAAKIIGVIGSSFPLITLPNIRVPNATLATFIFSNPAYSIITGAIQSNSFIADPGQKIPVNSAVGLTSGILKFANPANPLTQIQITVPIDIIEPNRNSISIDNKNSSGSGNSTTNANEVVPSQKIIQNITDLTRTGGSISTAHLVIFFGLMFFGVKKITRSAKQKKKTGFNHIDTIM